MKLTLELENLEQIVKTTLNENLESVITDTIKSLAKDEVSNKAKVIIEKIVNREISKYIREYIETATITFGGGWDRETKTCTVKEYLQSRMNECLQNKTFKKEDRYGSYSQTISFEEYIKSQIDINGEIKKRLKEFAEDIRKDVNENINQIFTESTKNTLSETVLSVLMATETYQKITNSVKMIASGNNND